MCKVNGAMWTVSSPAFQLRPSQGPRRVPGLHLVVKKASKTAKQVKTTAAKPKDLNPIPRIYMVEGEDRLSKIDLWLPHMCMTYPCVFMGTCT